MLWFGGDAVDVADDDAYEAVGCSGERAKLLSFGADMMSFAAGDDRESLWSRRRVR